MKSLYSKIFALIIFGILSGSPAFSQYIDWQKKVDRQVLDNSQLGPTDFIVWMAEQADVSEASLLSTKLEKGRYVYYHLSELAERTQVRAMNLIEKQSDLYRSFVVINAIWAKGDAKLIRELASLPEVSRILYNPSVHFDEPVEKKEDDNSNLRAIEWGVAKINANDVWALSGNPQGQGTVVGGQDTGYKWDHAALKLKYRGWNNSSNTLDPNHHWHDAIHQIDTHNSGSNPCGLSIGVPCDDDNHGTHTMGTMVGGEGANEIGVAPQAKWIGCRNMERGWGTPATYTECFNWFLAPTDTLNQNADPDLAPDVINNSWGCPPTEGCTDSTAFAAMQTALNNLKAAGIMVVVSAGNSGSNCQTVDDPAAIFENSFSVGATDSNDNIAGFSSRGPATFNGYNLNIMKPQVSAPGVGVRSSVKNGGYATYDGTSMAGPHVVGAVALMISAKPSLQGQVNDIEDILEVTALDRTTSQTCGGVSGSSIPNNTYGWGRIDVLEAVNNTLAVHFLSFSGIAQKDGNLLFWITEQEVNSNYFEIQRSSNGIDFETIGLVRATGSVIGQHTYQYKDILAKEGITYYRIREVGSDGSASISRIVSLQRSSGESLRISPTLTQEGIRIFGNIEESGIYTISLSSGNAQVVYNQDIELQKGINDLFINWGSLASGVYVFEIRNADWTFKRIEKIIIQR